MPGGELEDIIAGTSLPAGEGLGGDPEWLGCCVAGKKGSERAQSLVYCAALFVVELRAERRGV